MSWFVRNVRDAQWWERGPRGSVSQLVDDDSARTLAAASWLNLKKTFKGKKTEQGMDLSDAIQPGDTLIIPQRLL